MDKSILITGGTGFIGSNTAEYFLKKGWKVTIFDNFSREGAKIMRTGYFQTMRT